MGCVSDVIPTDVIRSDQTAVNRFSLQKTDTN